MTNDERTIGAAVGQLQPQNSAIHPPPAEEELAGIETVAENATEFAIHPPPDKTEA